MVQDGKNIRDSIFWSAWDLQLDLSVEELNLFAKNKYIWLVE